MLPLPPSRPREASSLLTGVQLVSKLVSTTSLQPSSLEVTRLRSREPSACSPTPPPLLRPGPDLTTSLTSCTPREPSSIGMLEKVWRKESSLRQERILLLLRRIMKRLVLILPRLMMMREMNTRAVFPIVYAEPFLVYIFKISIVYLCCYFQFKISIKYL